MLFLLDKWLKIYFTIKLKLRFPFIQKSIKRHGVNIITYNPIKEEVKQWIRFNNTDK